MKSVPPPSPAQFTPYPLEDHLCFALYSASIAVGRLYKPMLDRLGITYPQYLVLRALGERDGQTVGAIAERLALEPSTLTPLIKRLEARELVLRRRNASDERQVFVSLSDAGRRVDAEAACLAAVMLSASGATPEALRALTGQVQNLRDAIDMNRAARETREEAAPAT